MGCGSSQTSDFIKKQQVIVKVKVSEIPPIPVDKQEEFKQKYLSNAYIHEGEEGFDDRIKNSTPIMFTRWEWLQKNKDTYVNMLRLSHHSDDAIQDCLDGKKPICYDQDTFDEIRTDLIKLKQNLEASNILKDISFVHTGSAVAAYSSNPNKGLRDTPSKITDKGQSDVDIVIISSSVKQFVEEKMKSSPGNVKEFPCVCSKEGLSDIRYGVRGDAIPVPVTEFVEKWKQKLGGGVQITYQNANPVLPPWELPIDIVSIKMMRKS